MPTATDSAADSVSVVLDPELRVVVPNVAVTPVGTPVADSVTGWAFPDLVIDTLGVTVPFPWVTDPEAGDSVTPNELTVKV